MQFVLSGGKSFDPLQIVLSCSFEFLQNKSPQRSWPSGPNAGAINSQRHSLPEEEEAGSCFEASCLLGYRWHSFPVWRR